MAGWLLLLATFGANALADGAMGWAAMAIVVLASGAYALGGGVLDGSSAALRGVAAVVMRWVLAAALAAALVAREGAVVWAVLLGWVLSYVLYLASVVTFKRL